MGLRKTMKSERLERVRDRKKRQSTREEEVVKRRGTDWKGNSKEKSGRDRLRREIQGIGNDRLERRFTYRGTFEAMYN